jgi:hypothetical protein
MMLAYGVCGLALLVIATVSVTGTLAEVGPVSASVERQRQDVIRALDTTAATLDDAGSGLGRLDTSLSKAHDSTGQAATLSRGVAETMRQASSAMNVSVFGAQPLVGLVASFDRAGTQLDALAGSIDGIATSLDANSADLRLTRTDIATLSEQIRSMTQTLRNGPSLEVPAATLDGVRLLLVGLMAWLGGLALAITVAGVVLVVRGRSRATGRARSAGDLGDSSE